MSRLELPDDFRDVLVAVADARADFVLIGGWAMAVHGHPRATEALDVLVRATPDNAARVFAALVAFGAPLGQHGVDERTFAQKDRRTGSEWSRSASVLTKISGVSFDEVIRAPVHAEIDGRTIPVIGHRALLANKRSAGRRKDLDDADWLERHGRG